MSAPKSWVVYEKTIYKLGSFPAVCPQHEWEAMEAARPGFHSLVMAGIPSEVEAERLARCSPRERALAAISAKARFMGVKTSVTTSPAADWPAAS